MDATSGKDGRNFRLKILAASLCVATILGIAVSFVLTYLNGSGLIGSGLPFLPFASAVVGYLVATRQPWNFVGWIFLVGALLSTVRAVSGEYAIYAVGTSPGTTPLTDLITWFAIAFRIPGPVLLFVLLPLFFPNGRVPSPGWRIFLWIIVLTVIPIVFLDSFAPGTAVYDTNIQNPFAMEWLALYSRYFFNGGPLIYWFIGLIFASAVSLVFRYRAAGTVERQQIKWLTLAVVSIPVWFTLNEPINRNFPLIFAVVDSLFIASIPVAAGIAILRYRLYDIDFIINKALVYSALTVFVVVVYIAFVGAIEYIIRTLTGSDSQIGIVVSTLIIAAIFNPLRRGIQKFVDRRFYRRKYDARATLEEFSGRLRDETDLEDLRGDLVSVVSETMKPHHVSLWLKPADIRKISPRKDAP